MELYAQFMFMDPLRLINSGKNFFYGFYGSVMAPWNLFNSCHWNGVVQNGNNTVQKRMLADSACLLKLWTLKYYLLLLYKQAAVFM